MVVFILKRDKLNERFRNEFIKYKSFHYDFISNLFENIDYEVLDDAVLIDEDEVNIRRRQDG